MAADASDLEPQQYLFDLRGYLVIHGVLEVAEVAELNRLIDAHSLRNNVSAGMELEFIGGGVVTRNLVQFSVVEVRLSGACSEIGLNSISFNNVCGTEEPVGAWK